MRYAGPPMADRLRFGIIGTGGIANTHAAALAALAALLARFGESRIEEWGEDVWEAFTLQALWRVCCEGVAGVPEFALPPLLPPRHRDLLLLATGEDADLPVHDLLIRFCGAFLDQGQANWIFH